MFKKLWMIALLLLMGFFLSCSTDSEDSETPLDMSLVGTWDLTSLTTTAGLDLNGDGTSSTNVLDELPCFTTEIIFSSDQTYRATTSDIEFTGTSLNDIMADCNGSTIETGTYEFTGNTLVLDSDVEDGTTTADVTLDDNMLTVSQDDSDLGPVILVLQRR